MYRNNEIPINYKLSHASYFNLVKVSLEPGSLMKRTLFPVECRLGILSSYIFAKKYIIIYRRKWPKDRNSQLIIFSGGCLYAIDFP